MKPRILIVEDDLANRQILRWRLEKIGDFEIWEATNGREALEMAVTHPLDCILMDLKMPVLDGWEATRQIRAREKGRHIPVVAVTAQAMAGDEERALAAGCDAWVPKPITHHNQIGEKIAPFLQVRLPGDVSPSPAYVR
jgi:two-component system cell cycle response regulator DivK